MGIHQTEIVVTSPVPAEKLYHALCVEIDTILPKALPGAVKNTEIQGDGGVGTIKHVHFGEGSKFEKMKQKIIGMDKKALTYAYSIIDGDVLLGFIEKIENHFTFTPTSDGGCSVKNITIFHTKGDAVIPEEDIKYAHEQNGAVFKAVEAYVLAN